MKRSQITGVKHSNLRNNVESGELLFKGNEIFVIENYLLRNEIYISRLDEVRTIVEGPKQPVKNPRMIFTLKVVFAFIILGSFIYSLSDPYNSSIDIFMGLMFNSFFYSFVLYMVYIIINENESNDLKPYEIRIEGKAADNKYFADIYASLNGKDYKTIIDSITIKEEDISIVNTINDDLKNTKNSLNLYNQGSIGAELERYARLLRDGFVTDVEFKKLKEELIKNHLDDNHTSTSTLEEEILDSVDQDDSFLTRF